MAITQAQLIYGIGSRTGQRLPSGSRVGLNGLSRTTGGGFPSGQRVGSGGLGGGSTFQQGQRTGSGGLSGGSTFTQGNRIGGGGLSGGSTFTQGKRVGSGGLVGGSTFTVGNRVGSGGLSGGSTFTQGKRVGSGGLVGGSTFTQGQRVGSGGLRFPSLRTSNAGSGGGIRISSRPISSGGLNSGSRRVGGGGGSRGNTYTPPTFIHIICGASVSGEFVLNIEEDFDPETGLALPVKINAFKATINQKEWTPENAEDWKPNIIFGNSENTDTRRINEYSGGWSDNCEVKMDEPLSNGRILEIKHVNLAIPNGDVFSSEETVTNGTPGTRIVAEEMIYLPS